MRSIVTPLLVAVTALPVVTGCQHEPEQSVCVARTNGAADSGPGYELLDLAGKTVWGTRAWTPEGYAEFSLPLSWWLWRKNDPRLLLADEGHIVRSPGCEAPGNYTLMHAFGREFTQVVRLIELRGGSYGRGKIRQVTLEKYHRLTYKAGRTVSLLTSPEDQQFIAVSRSLSRPITPPVLPEGWSLRQQTLRRDWKIELSGTVRVLRLTNEDSYQGPVLLSQPGSPAAAFLEG